MVPGSLGDPAAAAGIAVPRIRKPIVDVADNFHQHARRRVNAGPRASAHVESAEWVGHNIEDTAAALAADGDGDGEDTGEQVGPADAARSGGGLVGGGFSRHVMMGEGKAR